MKRNHLIWSSILVSSFFLSCQSQSEKTAEAVVDYEMTEEYTVAESDSAESQIMSSSAATYRDEKRKFIRKADVEMEVKNVYESTQKIESKAMALGGFVENSSLSSHIYHKEIFPISSDSAMEVRKYRMENDLVLRIPQMELHSFLISLGDEIEFLHHRRIEAKDVQLELLLADLEKERMNQKNRDLNQLKDESGKIKNKQEVIADLDQNTQNQNHQTIGRLNTEDQIAYSTIYLNIKEKEKIAQSLVINPKTYQDKYRPDFLYSAWNSVKGGFFLLQNLFIGLLYIWPLILIGLLISLLVRQQLKKRKTI